MKEIKSLYEKYVMPTYTKTPLVLVKGKGSWVWDDKGKKYLDFFPGWAVSGIGHCHPMVIKALEAQSKKILHVSNNYYNELQARLAEKISHHSFDGKCFFANSGAEANEAAVKFARKFGHDKGKFEIITFEKSFHGRTLAMIAATGQDKVKKGFEPLPEGFKTAKFNDIDSVKKVISDKTIGILIEPVQGEGGINVVTKEFMGALRELCDSKELLFILDEVQSGMGRTGKMFCYQYFDIEPDVMTLAKSLGGGMPIGAMIAKRAIADTLGPGTHAATFGGSPIICAAALAVFEAIEKEKLLNNVNKMGKYIRDRLDEFKFKFPNIKDVRGIGLMIGIELAVEGTPIYELCLGNGLLINCTQKNILRIMPPLTVNKEEIDLALGILKDALRYET